MIIRYLHSTALNWIGLVAVGVLVSGIAGILLISAGTFDPIPSQLAIEIPLSSVIVDHPQHHWHTTLSSRDPVELRLTAAVEASPAVEYGLVVGEENRYLAVTVSNEGYIFLWLNDNGQVQPILPRQAWFHLPVGAATHEIYLRRAGVVWSVWVNREKWWEGELAEVGGSAGTFAQPFGSPATIHFQKLEMNDPALSAPAGLIK